MDALVVAGRSSKSTSANHCIDFHKDVVSDVTSQLITDEGKTMEKASLCYATLWRVVTQFLCFGKAATAQPLRPGRSPGSVAKRKLSLKDFNKEKQAATIEIRLINVYDCVCICSNLDMLIGIMDESMRSSFGCPDFAPEKQRLAPPHLRPPLGGPLNQHLNDALHPSLSSSPVSLPKKRNFPWIDVHKSQGMGVMRKS